MQKASVKTGHGEMSKIEVKEIGVPELGAEQILVEINYSGLCASDKSPLRDD